MTPDLHTALAAVRTGVDAIAGALAARLSPIEQHRLELAFALRAGDRAAAVERAVILWEAMAVDPTVLATLVEYDHAELAGPARRLLERTLADATRDVAPAWRALAEAPGALDAWQDIISSFVANGSPLQAIEGVARALAAGVAGFELWSYLTATLFEYRRGHALDEALRLGELAFPDHARPAE